MTSHDSDLTPDAAAIRNIMFANDDVLETYFTMLAGGEFWDGGTYRLFLDLDTRAVIYRKTEPGDAPLNCGEDGLRLLYQVHEYKDAGAETLFDPDNDCMSLDNFGYQAWRKEMASAIEKALRQHPG